MEWQARFAFVFNSGFPILNVLLHNQALKCFGVSIGTIDPFDESFK
jgi:hypothetical protein